MKQGKLNYRGKINFRLLTGETSCAIKLLLWQTCTGTRLVGCFSVLPGVQDYLDGSGTVLQARRLQVQFSIGSSVFFIDLTLLPALWPQGQPSL
jgi:hypothetical protein